jgi:hypothetical protein
MRFTLLYMRERKRFFHTLVNRVMQIMQVMQVCDPRPRSATRLFEIPGCCQR